MNNPRVLYLVLCAIVGVINGTLAASFVKTMWSAGIDPLIALVMGFVAMIVGVHLVQTYVLNPIERQIDDD